MPAITLRDNSLLLAMSGLKTYFSQRRKEKNFIFHVIAPLREQSSNAFEVSQGSMRDI